MMNNIPFTLLACCVPGCNVYMYHRLTRILLQKVWLHLWIGCSVPFLFGFRYSEHVGLHLCSHSPCKTYPILHCHKSHYNSISEIHFTNFISDFNTSGPFYHFHPRMRNDDAFGCLCLCGLCRTAVKPCNDRAWRLILHVYRNGLSSIERQSCSQ